MSILLRRFAKIGISKDSQMSIFKCLIKIEKGDSPNGQEMDKLMEKMKILSWSEIYATVPFV